MGSRIEDPATILVVDDSQSNVDILLRLLSDHQVLVSLDGPTALEILEQTPPDLVLLDIMMPGMDGFEVCRSMRAKERWKDIPVLFITVRNDEESIVKGFEIGANDYVTKPFRPAELLARVRSQIRYKRAMEQLRYIAVTDDLTGILNRRAFFARGQDLFESARRGGRPLSALMLDIDFFKCINDTYGHAEGDQVLRCFASLVGECINGSDLFGRVGGEEFAIVPLHRRGDQAVELAEAVRRRIEAAEIPVGRHRLRFTVSIGVSHRGPGLAPAETFGVLLSQADRFLYIAKQRGRNCVHHPGIGGRVRHRRLPAPGAPSQVLGSASDNEHSRSTLRVGTPCGPSAANLGRAVPSCGALDAKPQHWLSPWRDCESILGKVGCGRLRQRKEAFHACCARQGGLSGPDARSRSRTADPPNNCFKNKY